MALLNESVRQQLREILGQVRPVDLELYGAGDDEATTTMRTLLAELAETVPGLTVNEPVDVPALEPGHDTGMPMEGPVLVVRGLGRGAVRFVGMTVGLEFSTLVEAIRQAGGGPTTLSPATVRALEALDGPVHIQVFTTPTCPYCPQAVHLAHEMAFASDKVVADMVDASTFPSLSDKYGVMGVPAQYFNGALSQVGAAPEHVVLDLVRKAARLGAGQVQAGA
jgi:glutaredoxin-like protein